MTIRFSALVSVVVLGVMTLGPASATDAAPTMHAWKMQSLGNTTPREVTPVEHAETRRGMTKFQITHLYGMRGSLSAMQSGPRMGVQQVRIYPCEAIDGGQTYVYFKLVGRTWRVVSTTWFGR